MTQRAAQTEAFNRTPYDGPTPNLERLRPTEARLRAPSSILGVGFHERSEKVEFARHGS
ncbi:hypothetical protein GCM10007890_14540 [Methylobacterium tardum]|uniref:Uncharacterized protein n=1 Tax=Methylobacterium tardum TaxID=374432 RepID=A0AA37T9I6_9HYPH|nr:hypothetical protein GCM10007890_14540 [Methylobacterium tardum]